MPARRSTYQKSGAYTKYKNGGVRPDNLLQPITQGPVHLAPGEVFCRWMDFATGLMCSQNWAFASRMSLKRHYTTVHRCKLVLRDKGGLTRESNAAVQEWYNDVAANKKPSWPMDTDTTPAETQAAPAPDVATSEAERPQSS